MKKVFFFVAIALLVFTVGCAKQPPMTKEFGLANLYIKTIDTLLNEDPALNSDIKFVAIEMDTLKGINEADKQRIEEYIKDKGYEIKNASIEDLKEQGEFDEEKLFIPNGVLIRIDKYEKFTDNRATFTASKYRSGQGAIGLLFNFLKSNDTWKLIKSDMMWIS